MEESNYLKIFEIFKSSEIYVSENDLTDLNLFWEWQNLRCWLVGEEFTSSHAIEEQQSSIDVGSIFLWEAKQFVTDNWRANGISDCFRSFSLATTDFRRPTTNYSIKFSVWWTPKQHNSLDVEIVCFLKILQLSHNHPNRRRFQYLNMGTR